MPNFILNIHMHCGKDEYEKVQASSDQEKAQSERNSHSRKTEWEKTKLTIRYLYLENISKPSEQLLPNRRLLSLSNLTKTMKTYITFKQ